MPQVTLLPAGFPSPCPEVSTGACPPWPNLCKSDCLLGASCLWDHWRFPEILVFWEGRTKINLAVGKSSMLFWAHMRTQTLTVHCEPASLLHFIIHLPRAAADPLRNERREGEEQTAQGLMQCVLWIPGFQSSMPFPTSSVVLHTGPSSH